MSVTVGKFAMAIKKAMLKFCFTLIKTFNSVYNQKDYRRIVEAWPEFYNDFTEGNVEILFHFNQDFQQCV